MGDTQAPRQEPKRSVIVTSTPSIRQKDIKQNISSLSESGFESPKTSTTPILPEENTAAMYGPTLAAHPHQWHYYPQQPPYMPQTMQPGYHQSSFHSSQQMYNRNNMNFQASMESSQQSVPYYESQQGMPGLIPFQQYPTASGPSSMMYQVSQPQNIPIPSATPQYNQNFNQGVYDPYSQSYPPPMSAAAFPTYLVGYPNHVSPQGMMQSPAQSQWPQPSYYSSTPYQSTGYNVEQQSGPSYNMRPHSQAFRRGSLPPNPAKVQSYMMTDADVTGHHRRQPFHPQSRPRRMSPTPSNTGRSSVASSSGILSTTPSTINNEDKLQIATNPSLPRGPPRKPRQSGHALWVGNLPPGVNVVALKDYFATSEIESVFLISKSNCAFVNYKTEDACNQAMIRFHDSRFQGIRLVCRLRRNTSPTGEASQTPTDEDVVPQQSVNEDVQQSEDPATDSIAQVEEVDRALSSLDLRGDNKERFFILKSLTVEDLDLSARNGVWATQSHNEPTLNAAYKSCENVYLIFSANKSGEYYGYAKMKSEISDEVSSKIEWAPLAHVNDDPHLPKAIYTAPTETAPKGRIIDDSSRGTIFWEAIDGDNQDDDDLSSTEETGEERTTVSKSWGKPFRVEWISMSKIPFYRTRGLRNSYNVSREVKIARDGTELEPSVGSKLLQMFQRSGISSLISSYEGTRTGSVAMINTPSDLSHSSQTTPISEAEEHQTHDENSSDTVTEETVSSSL